MMKKAVVIVASGSSRRMGFDKLAAEVEGRSVLERTIEVFLGCDDLLEIVCVAPREKWIAGGDERLIFCEGGKERADSVARGLGCLSSEVEWVGVHDGARPCVTRQMVEAVFSEAQEHGAATLAKRVVETVKRADAERWVCEAVDRENLWFMETPQVFRRDLIDQAYEEVSKKGVSVTDEVSALELIGVRTKCVEHAGSNLKITVPDDLRFLEQCLLRRVKKEER